jgi:hypothetical protein
MGLVPVKGGYGRVHLEILRAERLCDAYWTFKYLVPFAKISFEHMLLLLSEVARAEEIRVTDCVKCKAFLVSDALALNNRICAHCDQREIAHVSLPALNRCRGKPVAFETHD